MTPEWPYPIKCQKYPVYTEYSLRGPYFTPFRFTTSRFQDTGFSKIGNAPNDTRMTLSTEVLKVPCVHWIRTP